MIQNEKRFCLWHSISQEPHIIWLLFVVHKFQMIISPCELFIFSKFWFLGLLGGSKGKKSPKCQKILSASPCISGIIHHMIFIYCIHVKKDNSNNSNSSNNNNSQFCQKLVNGQFGPSLGQNYATLYLMISSKDLFEML